MKNTALSILAAACFLSFSSCSNSGGGGQSATTVGKCILSYRSHFNDLLTQDLIKKSYPADFSKARIDSSTFSDPKYWSFSYSWDGDKDRTRRIKVASIDKPMHYQISISGMKAYDENIKDPVAYFEGMYRNRTEAEKKKAQEAIEKQLDKSDVGEKTKERAKALAKKFTSGSTSLKFETIEGVGDAASWDYFEHALKVLVGRTQFQIGVDVSDDIAKNQALAKQLTKDIIDGCQ